MCATSISKSAKVHKFAQLEWVWLLSVIYLEHNDMSIVLYKIVQKKVITPCEDFVLTCKLITEREIKICVFNSLAGTDGSART